MLDNVAGLILMVGLLAGFGFPADFAVSAMVPGTAIGVMVGDLAFFVIAFRLARRTGRDDVTAMPLGLDTPSTFGIVLFILGPSYSAGTSDGTERHRRAPTHMAHRDLVHRDQRLVEICTFAAGRMGAACVPRAGLLGSLAAIALVLISFLPLMEILGHPLPGMLAIVVVLTHWWDASRFRAEPREPSER